MSFFCFCFAKLYFLMGVTPQSHPSMRDRVYSEKGVLLYSLCGFKQFGTGIKLYQCLAAHLMVSTGQVLGSSQGSWIHAGFV
ncbi:hypothetical protein FKM82_030664 [Ascaphus truei]